MVIEIVKTDIRSSHMAGQKTMNVSIPKYMVDQIVFGRKVKVSQVCLENGSMAVLLEKL